MAEAFNLNSFLQTYQQNTYDPTKQHAAAEINMEKNLQAKAEEAVGKGFLSLTLSEKMAEIGVGEKTIQQIKDTAANLVLDMVTPIGDYLEKYENVFDERIYNSEIQSYAKQMFFASQAMRTDSDSRPVGQKFVYDM